MENWTGGSHKDISRPTSDIMDRKVKVPPKVDIFLGPIRQQNLTLACC